MALPRLFISTDMQMMSGVNNIAGDKDDVQSLVHALLYQDKIDIVGIASSTSKHQPGANDEKFIHLVLDQYAKDQPKLEAFSPAFKTADELRQVTYQGTKTISGTSGLVAANEASRAIISEAREAKAAGEALYVAAWGGLGDVARALRDAPDIAATIRLLSASGPKQEPYAYSYIKNQLGGKGDLWWLDAQSTQVGIYASPEGKYENLSNSWAVANAKDHGSLGNLFYQNTIDVKGTLDDFNAVKMGDSFSVFYLLDAATDEDPTVAGWAGDYRKAGEKYWTDRTDISFDWTGSNGAPTTYAMRAAWQADFAQRMDLLKASALADRPDSGSTPGKSLTGTSANDTLTGGGGADVLDGKGGLDVMAGGLGDDIYFVDMVGDQVTEAPGEGRDTINTTVSWTLGSNLEDLALRSSAAINGHGNALNNSIIGNSAANTIDGKAGADRLEGRGGDDRLIGGFGDDFLMGGEGADVFIFAAGSGHDVIADFKFGGAKDRIQISGHADYSARQVGSDVLVSFGAESVLLQGVQASTLSAADFLFS